jgi:Fur family transcriptional regulator, peroxide stress response regulator
MRITRRNVAAVHRTAPPDLDVDQLCVTFARRCRAHGVRVTAQRLAVYRALAEDLSHPTADAIYRRLRGVMPSLSPATVYRVLESLERDGLLRRVSTTGGAGRFDANLAPHHHLICRVCGRMTDIHASTLAVGRVAARARPRFVVEDVDVRIVGRCETCPPAARPASGRTRRPHGTRPRPGRPGEPLARRQVQYDERRD